MQGDPAMAIGCTDGTDGSRGSPNHGGDDKLAARHYQREPRNGRAQCACVGPTCTGQATPWDGFQVVLDAGDAIYLPVSQPSPLTETPFIPTRNAVRTSTETQYK